MDIRPSDMDGISNLADSYLPFYSCCHCTGKPPTYDNLRQNVEIMNRWRAETIIIRTFVRFMHHIYHVYPTTRTENIRMDSLKSDLPLSEKELNMHLALLELLKEIYDIDPELKHLPKVTYGTPNEVRSVRSINDVLNHKLKRILHTAKLASKDPKRLLAGKASYRKLVVDCMLFAAKFAAEFMKNYVGNVDDIMDEVIYILLNFFNENQVIDWIKHVARVTDPFGVSNAKISDHPLAAPDYPREHESPVSNPRNRGELESESPPKTPDDPKETNSPPEHDLHPKASDFSPKRPQDMNCEEDPEDPNCEFEILPDIPPNPFHFEL